MKFNNLFEIDKNNTLIVNLPDRRVSLITEYIGMVDIIIPMEINTFLLIFKSAIFNFLMENVTSSFSFEELIPYDENDNLLVILKTGTERKNYIFKKYDFELIDKSKKKEDTVDTRLNMQINISYAFINNKDEYFEEQKLTPNISFDISTIKAFELMDFVSSLGI